MSICIYIYIYIYIYIIISIYVSICIQLESLDSVYSPYMSIYYRIINPKLKQELEEKKLREKNPKAQ